VFWSSICHLGVKVLKALSRISILLYNFVASKLRIQKVDFTFHNRGKRELKYTHLFVQHFFIHAPLSEAAKEREKKCHNGKKKSEKDQFNV
jgi:hypothetical protein